MKVLMTLLRINGESLKVHSRDMIWSILHFPEIIQATVWGIDYKKQGEQLDGSWSYFSNNSLYFQLLNLLNWSTSPSVWC